MGLFNLEDLRIDPVGLKIFPTSILKLSKLKYLVLPNDILSIPPDISSLRQLQTLNISSTQYEEKIMYGEVSHKKVLVSFLDSIRHLKSELPQDCIIETAGNIKY
jgi:Leucine-rich repeat (LRR) protein